MTEEQKTEIVKKIVSFRDLSFSSEEAETDEIIFLSNFIESDIDGAYTIMQFLLRKIEKLESDKEKMRDLAIKIYEL